MDLLHRVRALADDAAAEEQHALAQALHAVANLGGKVPAAVIHTERNQEPVVVVGPDLPAVLHSLGIADLAEYNALNGPGGTTAHVVREFRFVE